MNDAFSDYVMLLDDIEQIPLAARRSPSLSAEERALVVAQVVELVRDRVLPQSDREEACLEALLDDEATAPRSAARASGVAHHDAILAQVNELIRADPKDGAWIQELLYRVHTAIAAHFGEAEMIHALIGDEEPPVVSASLVGGRFVRTTRERVLTGASAWFG